MRKHKHEDLIDDYLLNKLSENEKKKFEEHYFNCPQCFEKMAEKDELISVVKNKGNVIFQNIYAHEKVKRVPLFEHLIDFLTPKQWAMAASTVTLALIVVFGILPILKTTSPHFFINEDLVRGGSVTLISPVINIKTVPSQFKWKSEGKDIEYKVYIYNHALLWKTTTKNNYISLPEDIKKLMVAGEKYSWQVKAFSPEGTLIAVSSRVQFMIHPNQ